LQVQVREFVLFCDLMMITLEVVEHDSIFCRSSQSMLYKQTHNKQTLSLDTNQKRMKLFRISIYTTSLAFMGAAAKAQDSCPEDARMCPDGSVLGRDPRNNCEFPPCNKGCPEEDFRVCADNMILLPDPLNNCKIPACPPVVADIPCGWIEFNGEMMCYNFDKLGSFPPGVVIPPGVVNAWLNNTCDETSGIRTNFFCGVSSDGTCEKKLVEEPCFDEEPVDDLEPAPVFLSGALDDKSVVWRSILATAGVTWLFLLMNA